jgi:hypothetical protein
MTDFNVYQNEEAGDASFQAEQQIAQLTAQLLHQQAVLAAASKYKLFTVVAVGLASTALVGGVLYFYGKAFSTNADSMNENLFAQDAKPGAINENKVEPEKDSQRPDDTIAEEVSKMLDQETPETIAGVNLNADFAASEEKPSTAEQESQESFQEEAKQEERAEAPYEKYFGKLDEIGPNNQPIDVTNNDFENAFWDGF